MTYPDRSYSSHPIQKGSIIQARYRVTGYLGEGGFAQVFEGRDLEIDRDVAIKAFSPLAKVRDPIQREQFLERFRMEARTAAKIRHPNVVTIHDIGVTDDLLQPYIVMELLHGHDMEKELKYHGPMAPKRVLPLFCECLEALGEGHQAGVIHKDLKPSNLYLTEPHTRRESLRIVDFGIARLGTDKKASRITGPNQILGTPQYYAPEYVRQQLVTPALDVYQMGLILVEMLTGRKVVASDDPYICLNRHCDGDLDLPKELMDSPLGTVLRRALARNVRERYQDAHAFCDALTWISPKKVPSWARPGSDALVKGGGTKELDLAAFKGRGGGAERPRRGTMELDAGGSARRGEGGRGRRRRSTFSLVAGGRSERDPDEMGRGELGRGDLERRPRTRRQRLRRLEGAPLDDDAPLALMEERRRRRDRLSDPELSARRSRDEAPRRRARERDFEDDPEWDDAPRERRSRRASDDVERGGRDDWDDAPLDDSPDDWDAPRPKRRRRAAKPRRRAAEPDAFYEDEEVFEDEDLRPRRKRRKKRASRKRARSASNGPSTEVFEAPARKRRKAKRASTTAAMEVDEAPRRRPAKKRADATTASLPVEPLDDPNGPVTAVFEADDVRGPKTATMEVDGFEDEAYEGGIHGATTASLTVETVAPEPVKPRRKVAPKPKPKPKPEPLNEGDIVINLSSAQQRRRKVPSASTTSSLNVEASTVVLTLDGGGHGNDRSGIAPAISGEVVVSLSEREGEAEETSEAQSPKTIVLDLGLSREVEREVVEVAPEEPEAASVAAVAAVVAADTPEGPEDDPDVALIAAPSPWTPEEAYAPSPDLHDSTSRVVLPEPKREERRGRWAAIALVAAVLLVVFGVVSWQGFFGGDESGSGGDAILKGAEANAMPPSRESAPSGPGAERAAMGGTGLGKAGRSPAMAMNDAAGSAGVATDAAPAAAGAPVDVEAVPVDSDAALLEAPELPIFPPLKGDPPVDAIFVKIVPEPAQAVVSFEERPIGQGPVVLMLKPGERERMKITLTHKGYVRKIITVRPSHAPELVLRMKEPSEVYDTPTGAPAAAPSAAAQPKATRAPNIKPMPRKAPIKVGTDSGLLIAQ